MISNTSCIFVTQLQKAHWLRVNWAQCLITVNRNYARTVIRKSIIKIIYLSLKTVCMHGLASYGRMCKCAFTSCTPFSIYFGIASHESQLVFFLCLMYYLFKAKFLIIFSQCSSWRFQRNSLRLPSPPYHQWFITFS